MLCLVSVLLFVAGVQRHESLAAPAQHLVAAEMLELDEDGSGLAPAAVESGMLAGTWTRIGLPHAQPADLLRQADSGGDAGAAAITWYRLRPSGPATSLLMLYAARIKADGPIAVYVGGKRIHQRQLAGPTWYWAPLWLELEAGAGAAPPREILFRLQHSRNTHTALASVWLGPPAALAWRYHGRQWLQVSVPVMSSGAFLAVGLFSLFVWFRRGDGQGYGLFALLAMAQFVRSLHFFCDFRIANDWFAWFSVNSLFWVITIVHAFQVLMHGRRQRWLSTGLMGINVLVALLSLPLLAALPNTPQVTPLIYLLAMAASIAVTAAGCAASWRHSREAMLVTAGIGSCFLYGVNDWALQSNFLGPESWYLGPYMNLQNFALFCYLMYGRYIGALAHVEQSKAQLAQRLQAREAELAQSYQRLSEIEHRQTVAEERQRLMQDMHDGLGSSLHSALRAIERGKLDALSVSAILRACIDDLHLTIDSMEPVEADLLLLLATLRYRLGGRLHSAGIELKWDVVNVAPLDWIDPRTALHILRILQEALSNIVRHTKATTIRVATASSGGGVQVCVSDNGAGFEVGAALRGGGKGLGNQQRRATAIGGRIEWKSGRAGTRVTLWLPQSRPAPHPAPPQISHAVSSL